MRIDGRRFAKDLTPIVRELEDGKLAVLAPSPGLFREGALVGARLGPGAVLGELEVLGRLARLVLPEDAYGLVVAGPDGARRARAPVAHGTRLVTLDPSAAGSGITREQRAGGGAHAAGNVFRTPLGGRYYARPAPGAEAFVKVGDEIGHGTTVAIVEVMKTFNRVQYGGASLPERAKVVRIVPKDGDDLTSGDALLEIAPL